MEAVHQCSAQGLQFTPGARSPERQEYCRGDSATGAGKGMTLKGQCAQIKQNIRYFFNYPDCPAMQILSGA